MNLLSLKLVCKPLNSLLSHYHPLTSPMHFLLFFLPSLLLFLITKWWRRWRRRQHSCHDHLSLPPGPSPLPLIGNMLIMNQLTHRGLAKLAEHYGGLFHLRLGLLHLISVSTPDIAREVLQTHDKIFANRPATIAIAYLTYNRADMVFAHYSPFWCKVRRLCAVKLFSHRRAESWASVRDALDCTIQTAAASMAGSKIDVGELAFDLSKNVTLRAAFGAQSYKEQDEFVGIMQEFSKLFAMFSIGDFVPWLKWVDVGGMNGRLRKARASLDRFIDKIIDEHLANRKDGDAEDADMVDGMLAYFGEEGDDEHGKLRLTRDNIKGIIMDVMFGGTETIASTIEWAMSELLKSPHNLRTIQQELAAVIGLHRKVHDGDLTHLPFLKSTVKETLRLHAPVPLGLHETAEDCRLAGFFIPAGARVMVNFWAIGRDKSSWKDADEFRPSRFMPAGEAADVEMKGNHFALLPFGSGRRSCPGMQLALYAVELALAQLLHCFDWELPDGMKPGELDMGDVAGLTASKAVRLIAVPTPRLHCPL